MPAVGGVAGTLVGAETKGQLPYFVCSEVDDLDVEAGASARRVRNFVIRARRPGGAIAVRLESDAAETGAVDPDDVDLR